MERVVGKDIPFENVTRQLFLKKRNISYLYFMVNCYDCYDFIYTNIRLKDESFVSVI